MTRETAVEVHLRLRSVYGAAFSNDLSKAIHDAFKTEADEAYIAAIEALLRSTDTPPTIAAIQQELTTQSQLARRFDAAKAVQEWANVDVPSLPHFAPRCRHCDGTGVAHFWFSRKNDLDVWTVDDPPRGLDQAKIASAVCDCPAGMNHRSREAVCTVWFHGHEQTLPARARLEIIRRLADRRADRERYEAHDNA